MSDINLFKMDVWTLLVTIIKLLCFFKSRKLRKEIDDNFFKSLAEKLKKLVIEQMFDDL